MNVHHSLRPDRLSAGLCAGAGHLGGAAVVRRRSLDLPKDVGVAEIVLMLPYLLPEAVAQRDASGGVVRRLFGVWAAQRGKRNSGASARWASPPGRSFGRSSCWRFDEPDSASGCTTSANRGDKRESIRSCVNSAETIAYRYLRTKHAYTKGTVTLNVKAVEGRKLIRPMLIMERPDHGEPITIAAEEGELRTQGRNRELSLVMRNGTAYIGDGFRWPFPRSWSRSSR